MEKINYYIDQVDRELKKVSILNTLDEKAKIPKLKTYITLGLGVIISIFIFFNIFGDLLSTLVAFIYPAYASFKAIESADKNDDTQVIRYKIIYFIIIYKKLILIINKNFFYSFICYY